MNRFVFGILFCLFFSVANVLAQSGSELYPFAEPRQNAQFQHLLKDLRCLVCQNQDLSDSNAPLAQDLKNHIYSMVKNNQSDQEIIQYLTDRYGDFILFNPPIKPVTYLLWFGPFLFVALGAWIFYHNCQRGRRYAK